MENLPPEILERIFRHLSLPEILHNVALVCHNWRDITSRSGFIPWRKLYFQFKIYHESGMKRIEYLLIEHQEILSSSIHAQIIVPDSSLMFNNEFQMDIPWSSETFLPWILEFVSLEFHSASFIEIQHVRNYNFIKEKLADRFELLDVASHNAVIAIVLALIAPDVWSIHSIIQLSLSFSELYYCLATWLLVAQRFKKIPPRYGYNLFHALYFSENDAPDYSTSKEHSPKKRRIDQHTSLESEITSNKNLKRPTVEQMRIINHSLADRDVIKIEALAGTGKSTTLLQLTQKYPGKYFLLIVFNKKAQETASMMFPKENVMCKTVHSMAFSKVGVSYRHKLVPSLKAQNILESGLIEEKTNLYLRSGQIVETLNRFMNSSDMELSIENVPSRWVIEKADWEIEETIPIYEREIILSYSKKVWEAMIHQKNTSVPITHDGYLKLWQLRQPNLQTIVSHDVLLIDEAQDINPTMLDIINHQSTAKVIVGDPNQQIYSFRGAVNLLKEFKSSKKFSLTQSFRFGPEIAFVANCCLEHLKKNDERTLVGGRNRDMLVGSDKDVVGPVTIIGRTNGGVFQEIVRRICESDDEVKGCIIGGDKLLVEYKNLLYLREEKFNRMTKYKRFRSISSLEIFANQSNDHQLKSLISLVNCYDLPNFRRILEKIKKRCFHNEANADFVFTTAHLSKGLEWDSVYILDDFGEVLKGLKVNKHIPDDEKNLLYVAITRAKKTLILTKFVYCLLGSCNYFFTRISCDISQMYANCIRCNNKIDGNNLVLHEISLSGGIRNCDSYVCTYCSVSPFRKFKFTGSDPLTSTNVITHDMNNRLFRFLLGPKTEDYNKITTHFDTFIPDLNLRNNQNEAFRNYEENI